METCKKEQFKKKSIQKFFRSSLYKTEKELPTAIQTEDSSIA